MIYNSFSCYLKLNAKTCLDNSVKIFNNLDRLKECTTSYSYKSRDLHVFVTIGRKNNPKTQTTF